MRRAAVSIPASIAGGFRRRGQMDKARFMNLAEGSLEECRYYLILAQDLGYGDTAQLATSAEELSRLLGPIVWAGCSTCSRLEIGQAGAKPSWVLTRFRETRLAAVLST